MATALDLLMSTKEDVNLLSQESDICTIDAKTRAIFVPSTIVVGGVQSDKNAERIKFSCPKIVGDNLDLSKFSVRINFENVSSVDFNVSIKDQYICDDVAVDGENVTFSWLIGRNAARYMGTVRFIVCAVKTDSDSNISVEWNTTIAEVPVLEGIEIDQPQIGQEEKDVINQLLELTKNTSAEAVQNVNSAKEQAIKDIQSVSQPDTTLTIEGGLAEAKATGEAIDSLKEDIGDKKALYAIEHTWIDGKFVSEYSQRIDYIGSKIAYIADATPLIDKTIHVKTCAFGDMAYVVSDASWKRLLSGKSGNTSAVEEPWEFDITIPTNAKYIQISYSTRYPSIEFEMYEEKGTLFEMVKKIDDNLNEVPNENPLSVIRKDAGLLHVFRKVGCIGDSLSSGCCVFKNAQGIEQGADLYEFSWGQYLARMTGNTYYNFSRGGWSTRDWLTGDLGGNLAFDGNHACDCYFIGLGQNDNNQSIPVGTRGDINLSDPAQNADTYYGNYGKIIQKIQVRYPKAKIFVMTDPLDKASSPENNGYNDAVRTIATMFNNVYLMDLYRYGKEMYDYYGANLLSINRRYAHFNAVGYYLCALNIATYADWIMRKNPTEFLEVEFINTDMHYN